MISVLNSVASLNAQNALASTQTSLQNTLQQLSTGLKINSGADDAAGLSIANGLGANIAALSQSSQNASNGVGLLQTADGALSQVTALLSRAVTLATEAATGGLTTGAGSQSAALQTEFKSILDEIDQIGASTNFNGNTVFANQTVYTTDGTTSVANATTTTSITALTANSSASSLLGATVQDISTVGGAQTALTALTTAIGSVSATRGTIGASINRLSADVNVENTEVTNLTSAQNSIQNADIGKTVSKMTQFNVLQQTGMAALSQANQAQQTVLKLLQ